jgi:DNA-binding NtrC family response regulator
MDEPTPIRALVVGSEPLIRWAVPEALSAGAHTAVGAHTAAAVRLVVATAPEPFDVILFDFRLPDSQDLSLLADLRRMSPGSNRLYDPGGFAMPAVVEAALGACRALTKPVDVETIGDVVIPASHEMRDKLWRMPVDAGASDPQAARAFTI